MKKRDFLEKMKEVPDEADLQLVSADEDGNFENTYTVTDIFNSGDLNRCVMVLKKG